MLDLAVVVDFGLLLLATDSADFVFGFDVVLVLEASSWDFAFDLLLEATSISLLRVGLVGEEASFTGAESDSGIALDGGCSFEAMAGGGSSATGAGELRLPHFDGLSAQAST